MNGRGIFVPVHRCAVCMPLGQSGWQLHPGSGSGPVRMACVAYQFHMELGGKREYGCLKIIDSWGPAQEAGMMQLDFIKAVNGCKVQNLADFKNLVEAVCFLSRRRACWACRFRK